MSARFEVGQVIQRSPEWLQRRFMSYGAGFSDAERRRNAGYLEAHKSARWTIVAIAPPKGNSLIETLECVSAEGGKLFTGACSDWQVSK